MQKGRPARESRDARSRRSAGRSTRSSNTRYSKARRSSAEKSLHERSVAGRPQAGRAPADIGRDEQGLVRLNKYLASHGIASRRGCDELIADGAVMVDDEIVTDLGVKVDPSTQRVEVDGVILKPEGVRHRYYLLNKPSGVVCTNSERELRPRAVDLITDRDKGRIFTVGRLDEETTGLILVTNDGEFANRVMHPRYGVDKTYRVKVAGRIEDAAIRKIRGGVHLSDGRTSGARVLVQKRSATASRLLVTIQEGKNREVRRMFARAGYKVSDLRRVRIGPLTDRGLKPGSWRPLRRTEIDELLAGPVEREERRGRGRRGDRDEERTERGDRTERNDRNDRNDRNERAERNERSDRNHRAERGERNERGGRGQGARRQSGGARDGRGAGADRTPRRLPGEDGPTFARRVLADDGRSRGRGGDRDRRGSGREDRRGDASGAAHPAAQRSNRAARREGLAARERSRGRRDEGDGGRRVVS